MSDPTGPVLPAEAVVDLGAVRSNVAALREHAASAEVMAVVKADAYGHGLVPSARAARAGGATWLGVAQLAEGLALRRAGDTGRLLSWLHVPGDDFGGALTADIDLSASAPWALDEIAAAARATGGTARVHLKIDTGLSRGGATADQWTDLVEHALRLQAEGCLEAVGVWSHLAWADAPQHPTVARQREAFDAALEIAGRRGLTPQVRHLANSAATLTSPALHYDLVRPGLAVYGLSPVPDLGSPADFGLRPAMTLQGRLALVKAVPAGSGVSYGHAYTTPADTTLALVPLGYGDGLPRAASNVGPLQVAGRRHTIAGRVCMDQVVVDLGDRPDVAQVRAGDPVVVFGDAGRGEPTAQDWAEAVDTISYEIVTRIGSRVPRRYVEEES
ncbi:alanine racemase [Angustibacter sp. Root456]|uniref:alanine racemase n=1 Tax=Angustibacter sp. Root456 TaxID=1736539 RepID=UPI0006F295C1|nr:alanine racemase [Angustibacter sp. Root456]KQX66012.1 alanine racemase [Angustibacter sp. Root456]